MNMTNTVSELAEELRISGDEFRRRVSGFTAEELETGIYENGWNGQEVVAHIAGIEWSLPGLIKRTVAEPAPQESAPGQSPPRSMDRFNAREVARRKEAGIGELLDEFTRNRETTIAAVQGLTSEELSTPARSLGGANGTLADVLRRVATDHLEQHLREIEARVAVERRA